MKLTSVRIRNFRSIEDVTLPIDDLTVVCGTNSCGKSNVMRALSLALEKDVTSAQVQENITQWKTGPRTAIHIDLYFQETDAALVQYAEPDGSLKYSCKLYRGRAASRQVGNSTDVAAFDALRNAFQIVYVPPIRDLNAGGLQPFRKLLKEALLRTRGTGNLNALRAEAEKLFRRKARSVLRNQTNGVSKLLGDAEMALDFNGMDLGGLAEQISLKVISDALDVPLQAVGTGHQSTVIMDLYRQLGGLYEGNLLFMFEEPENHLHPSTIRCVGDDFDELSKEHQVLLSTHSPYLLSHFGLARIRRLGLIDGITTHFPLDDLFAKFSLKDVNLLMETYGVQAVEPLLAELVVVVEGPTDRTVLRKLFEMRRQTTVDTCDILVIAAEGKDRVVNFCEVLELMRVEWRAVLDWDAAFANSVPHVNSISNADKPILINNLQQVAALLDINKKRGRNAEKTLGGLIDELRNGPQLNAVFDRSPVDRLIAISGELSPLERIQLKTAIETRSVKAYRELLKKANCWLWADDLEAELVRNAGCEGVVENTFIRIGTLTGPCQPAGRKNSLMKKLHGLANEPVSLAAVVEDLENGGHFARSAMNQCFGLVFG